MFKSRWGHQCGKLVISIHYKQLNAHEQHLLMLQTANENEKRKHVRKNSPIYTTTKKARNDGLESGDGEKIVLEKRKKEQEGVGHHSS